MRKIVKQVVGVDVAQNELVVCVGRMHNDLSSELYAHKAFPNTSKGFISFIAWVTKLTDSSVAIRYVMEATGVYHESFAYYLDEQNFEVSIVLPNKISNYARTLDTKTITDKTASEAITLFGLERTLDQWHRPDDLFSKLRQLTRERGQLIDERTVLKNQLHAEKAGAMPHKKSIVRMEKRIALIDKQEKEIMEEIKAFIETKKEIKELADLLCSIVGVGLLTAATVLGETNGFDLIRNKRQLTSYAGLDIKEKQSGTSVKGKPKISKKGNKYLRKAMHMPALTAIGRDERYKAVFARLVSKHGIKMKAVVAVQRKLLEMMYTVYKTGKPYNKTYLQDLEKEINKIIEAEEKKETGK
jgi:transposase